jgi:hypothetical protein
MMTTDDYAKLVNWLATGGTERSSEYVAYALAGVPTDQLSGDYPHDYDDVGRIVDLLDLMNWHERFKADFGGDTDGIRHGQKWRALFGVWDELVELYRTKQVDAVWQLIRPTIYGGIPW